MLRFNSQQCDFYFLIYVAMFEITAQRVVRVNTDTGASSDTLLPEELSVETAREETVLLPPL